MTSTAVTTVHLHQWLCVRVHSWQEDCVDSPCTWERILYVGPGVSRRPNTNLSHETWVCGSRQVLCAHMPSQGTAEPPAVFIGGGPASFYVFGASEGKHRGRAGVSQRPESQIIIITRDPAPAKAFARHSHGTEVDRPRLSVLLYAPCDQMEVWVVHGCCC